MLIEIAIFGLKVMVRWKLGIKNMGRGFMPRLLCYIRSQWWLSWFFMQQRKRLVRMVLGKGRGMLTTKVEPMVGQPIDKECAKSEADIKENLMSQV